MTVHATELKLAPRPLAPRPADSEGLGQNRTRANSQPGLGRASRLPSGWFILPAALLGLLVWLGIGAIFIGILT